MFKMIDTDNSGQITLEELKNGLERVGSVLKDSEINWLMQAVSACRLSKNAFHFHPFDRRTDLEQFILRSME